MGGWRSEVLGWRGLLAAALLSTPAWAQETEAVPEAAPESSEEEVVSDEASAEPVQVAQVDVPAVGSPVSPAAPTSAPVKELPPASAAKPKKPKKPIQEPIGESPTGSEDPEAREEDKPRIQVFGRVFARATADERREYARSMDIPSARLGVGASFRNVEAEVTGDLSSKNILKDAFVRVADNSKRLRLYAGRFKAPFLARENVGTWALPVMNRGLVNDYLTETHQMGGRRFGLMGEVRLKQVWDLRVSAGMFQGAEDDLGQQLSEDASARVSVTPFKKVLTLGASTYLGEVLQGTRRHSVAADATLNLGAFALSGEYVTGQLPLGPFNAQLGLVSYTLPLDAAGEWAVQPVAGAEALQLRGEIAGQGWSALGGINILFADSFRAQFQVERALRPGDAAPGLEYSLQLATRF
jgi:hypothetical protein